MNCTCGKPLRLLAEGKQVGKERRSSYVCDKCRFSWVEITTLVKTDAYEKEQTRLKRIKASFEDDDATPRQRNRSKRPQESMEERSIRLGPIIRQPKEEKDL